MSIVRWNLKEAGCGEHTNPWANLWSNEQKPHKSSCVRIRLHSKSKSNNYTESCMVNVVPGEVCAVCPEKNNHYREIMPNAQKSAAVIVVER